MKTFMAIFALTKRMLTTATLPCATLFCAQSCVREVHLLKVVCGFGTAQIAFEPPSPRQTRTVCHFFWDPIFPF